MRHILLLVLLLGLVLAASGLDVAVWHMLGVKPESLTFALGTVEVLRNLAWIAVGVFLMCVVRREA